MRKFRLVLSWLTLVGLMLAVFGAVPALAGTIQVDADDTGCVGSPQGDPYSVVYCNIQDAVTDAAAGDTINVAAGTYAENVTVNKADLTLQSVIACGAVIQGNVDIADGADGVTVDGFEIDAPSGDSVHVRTAGDVTITNNCIVGEGPTGGVDGVVYTHSAPSQGGTVSNNTIEECELGICTDHDGLAFTVSGNTLEHNRKAICPNDGGALITDNIVKNSTSMGIEVFKADISEAHNNCLEGNATGVWNGDTTNTFDAEDNYWGCADGPGGSGCDTVSGDVDYAPWLSYCPLVSPTTVWVDDDYDEAGCTADGHTWQYDCFNNIQDGVDAVTSSTVYVAAGTYNEDVTVNASLTLNGAQAGVDARGRSASESEIVGVVEVTSAATNVVFDGFKFTSPTRSFTPRGFNLRVESDDSTIQNCIFVAEENAGHSYSGYLDFGGITNTTVERNSFSGDLDPTQAPNVILLGITGAGTVTVADNEMHDVGGGGGIGIMCSNDSAVINIEDNEIDNTGDGIWIWNGAPQTFSVSITGNDIHNCAKKGVKVVGGGVGTVGIHYNNIYDNAEEGVFNGVAGLTIDAENNYWGDVDGPEDTADDGGETAEVPPCTGDPASETNTAAPDGSLGDKVDDTSTEVVDYCPWSVMEYWKPDYPDYAPSGMPDFDQRQDAWTNPVTGKWSFCGPVAVANCFWWFDSKFESLLGGTGVPGDGNDLFPLVRDYTDNLPIGLPGPNWDDHNTNNVDDPATAWPPAGPPPALPPFTPGPQPQPQAVPQWGELIERLAWCMDTDGVQSGTPGKSGTNVNTMQACINTWLADAGLDRHFYEHTEPTPTFEWVEREVERSQDVILLLGFYEDLGGGSFERRGGHYVTVAGINSDEGWIAFSDPIRDNAEAGGAGRVRNGSIIAHAPPHAGDATQHNDAGNVSHDVYQVMDPSPSPGGEWGLVDYWGSDLMDLEDNENPSFPTVPLVGPPTGEMFTEVEYAVAISPKPVLWVDPDDGWVEESNPANITIDVRITANEFNGVEFFLDFDPDLLSVVDISEGSMWAGSGYGYTVVKKEEVQLGTIWFAAYLQEPDTNIDVYDEQVATIEFHGQDAGVSDLDLNEAVVSNTEGESIEPVFLEDGTLTVFGHGCVHGIVEVQGRFGPNWDGADVTASGGPGGGYNYNTTVTNADGTWQICDITEGEYDVAVEMALYLDGLKEDVSIVDEGDTDVGQVKVLGGDCNDSDGVQPCGAGQEGINTLDATIVGGAFGASSGDGHWNPLGDINDDGTVNILDASLLGGNWHKCSPVTWS